jgi:pilus assembly protein CpaF
MSLLKRLSEQGVAMAEKPSREIKVQGMELKLKLHKYIVQAIKRDYSDVDDQKVVELVPKLAESFFVEETGVSLSSEEKHNLLNKVKDELIGYGPITPLLEDPSISEVMVNGPNQVYVEKGGRLVETDAIFRDDEHVIRVIEKIVSPLGRRIDESSPMVDARLPDGSRVNAIIPPLALCGPTITIRKFPEKRLKVQDLVGFGTLTQEMAFFLDAAVKSRLNVLISGGTGSGKTTLLNVLSSFIPEDERIVTIEDAAELKLSQRHVVSLETRPSNLEGKGRISIRDLVRNSLRMRPDRIIVGEVRSGEALDMLQAMNTGHDGSMTTGHANSPRDMVSRLETMVLMAGMDLPVRAIREQICNAVDLIVQQSRLKDGSRRITHITEILNMEGEVVVTQDLFLFRQTGVDADGKVIGQFTPTGIRPHCMEKLEHHGIALDPAFFHKEW